MTKDQSLDQLNRLFLADPQTGEDLVFCSPLMHNGDGTQSFDLMNVSTGQKQRVVFQIEEI